MVLSFVNEKEDIMGIRRVNHDKPFEYGDKVYYAYPPMDRRSVIACLDDFDGKIHEYMVLFQFHDHVVVTSEEYVAKRVKESTDYWNETDEDNYYKNCTPHDMSQAAITTIWRGNLFETREEAVSFQKDCIAEMHRSLDKFAGKLEKA